MVKIIENYTLHEQIGQGQYGKVYRGVDSKTSREVAVKVIHVKRFKDNPKLQQCTLNEIEILSKIECPYIVKFIEILKTVNNFYFFYEFCNGGTLDQEIKKHGKLSQSKVVEYLEQLLQAFKILSARNIMHRDLKPSNIMLHNGKIKLGDFGFCKGLENQRDLAQTMLGSPIYMAPEVLKGQIYTIKADIWSLGVVAYEMAFGFCPFEQNSIAKLISVLDYQEVKINKQVNPISNQLQNLIRKCLVKDHFKRISWQDLFNYPLRASKVERQSQPFHQRALSEYNRLPKRDSDLTFDKSKKPTEDGKLFKKKQVNENTLHEDIHQNLLETSKIIHKFITNNMFPEITLVVALKCYKLVEREHQNLGSQYLNERVNLTEAVIQIETLLEDEKNISSELILNLIKHKGTSKQIEAISKILKLTDEKEKHLISQFWVKNFQKQFMESSLILTN